MTLLHRVYEPQVHRIFLFPDGASFGLVVGVGTTKADALNDARHSLGDAVHTVQFIIGAEGHDHR